MPGSLVIENPPAKAGKTGLIPGLGSFHVPQSNRDHVPQLLSPSPKASRLLSSAHSQEVPQPEKPLRWEAHAPQLENALVQQQRVSATEKKLKLKNNKTLQSDWQKRSMKN